MKKYLIIILSLLIFILPNSLVYAAEIPAATEKFYVNDFANILSDEQEKQITDKASNISDKYDGVQIVVTTIKSTNGADFDNYATKMYNTYKIGNDSRGALIIVATEDRKVAIRTGDNFTKVISDSTAKRITDNYGKPKLKNNDFAGGIMSMFEETCNVTTRYYDKLAQEKNDVTLQGKPSVKESSNTGYIVGMLLIASGWMIHILVIYCAQKKKDDIRKADTERTIYNYQLKLNNRNNTIYSLKNEVNYANNVLKEKTIELEKEKKKINLILDIYPDALIRARDKEEVDNIKEKKKRLLNLYTKLKNLKTSSISNLSKSECDDYIFTYKEFKKKFEEFKNIPIKRDGEIAKEINEVLELIYIKDDLRDTFDKNNDKIKERLIALEEEENKNKALNLEKTLEKAKRSRSKYDCKEAIREYENSSYKTRSLVTPLYISMYNDMKYAVNHPTHSNDFFPAEHDYNSSNHYNDNGYSSSFDTFSGFDGFSSGGGASDSF